MPPADLKSLLDPELIRRLDQLEVLTHRVFRGRQKGERRSARKGVSIEFADYRPYVSGDDTRFLDWNLFGRLDRLYLKLFQEEEDLVFYILVDGSGSMNFGTPQTKFEYARRMAAALGYIALANHDKVGVSLFNEGVGGMFRPARGKGQLPKLLSFLLSMEVGEKTNLTESCRDFVLQGKQPGIVIVISDFLDERGYEEALKHFFMRPYEVYLIHLLSPEERKPTLTGHLELLDSETNEKQEVTVSEGLLRQYQETLEKFCGGLRDWATSRGMQYLATTTDVTLEVMLMTYLRQRGLLR